MNITISIDCDNAAFDPMPGYEISRILSDLAQQLHGDLADLADQEGEVRRPLLDINGNRVGYFEVLP